MGYFHMIEFSQEQSKHDYRCGHFGAIYDIQCFKHTNHCVTGSKDGSIRLWNLDNKECVMIFRDTTNPENNECLCLSID